VAFIPFVWFAIPADAIMMLVVLPLWATSRYKKQRISTF